MDTSNRFNDAARTNEQKEVGGIEHDHHRQNLLREIRERTEFYLNNKERGEHDFQKNYKERFSERFTELIKDQGYNLNLTPPGVRRNLEREADRDVRNAHAGDLNNLKESYEKEVREQIDRSTRVDRLEDRAEQYSVDRDAWVAQRGNVLEHLSQAQTAADRQHYDEILQCVDRSWSRTVERHFDTERDRGLTPEHNRVAHDIGRSR